MAYAAFISSGGERAYLRILRKMYLIMGIYLFRQSSLSGMAQQQEVIQRGISRGVVPGKYQSGAR